MPYTKLRTSALIGALSVSLLQASTAAAQVTVGNESDVQQVSLVDGPGVKVGEGTVLRPIVSAETGFVSNLFYESTDTTQVAALRIMAALSTGSASPSRTDAEASEGQAGEESKGEAPSMIWSAGGRLTYTEFPFASTSATMQRNLAADANIRLVIKPEGTFRFEFSDHFARVTNPTNFESRGQLNREANELLTGVVYQPGGRAITAGLHYKNRVDVFENGDHDFANRVQHTAILSAGWQWLPITKFSFQGSFGFFGPLGTSAWKQESNPMQGRIGVATAITEKMFGRASLGWAFSGYTFGEGYNTPVGDLELGFRYAPTGRFTIAYSYDFQDSINANYFRDHALLAKLDHQFGKVMFRGIADVRLRGYRGVPMSQLGGASASREDFLLGATAVVGYLYRDWLSFDGRWKSMIDQTDFRYSSGTGNADPSFTRHEMFVGATAAF